MQRSSRVVSDQLDFILAGDVDKVRDDVLPVALIENRAFGIDNGILAPFHAFVFGFDDGSYHALNRRASHAQAITSVIASTDDEGGSFSSDAFGSTRTGDFR